MFVCILSVSQCRCSQALLHPRNELSFLKIRLCMVRLPRTTILSNTTILTSNVGGGHAGTCSDSNIIRFVGVLASQH